MSWFIPQTVRVETGQKQEPRMPAGSATNERGLAYCQSGREMKPVGHKLVLQVRCQHHGEQPNGLCHSTALSATGYRMLAVFQIGLHF